MKLTIDFKVNDRHGTPLAVGDVVEVTPNGERKTIESFDLLADITHVTGEVQDISRKGYAQSVNFKGGGFAHPSYCTKTEPTTAERIDAVLNDNDLTDGEALDEVLRIIGHKREGSHDHILQGTWSKA